MVLIPQAGFNDRAAYDATQVISYFNYINRITDALGVEPEDFIRPWETAGTRMKRGSTPSLPVCRPKLSPFAFKICG